MGILRTAPVAGRSPGAGQGEGPPSGAPGGRGRRGAQARASVRATASTTVRVSGQVSAPRSTCTLGPQARHSAGSLGPQHRDQRRADRRGDVARPGVVGDHQRRLLQQRRVGAQADVGQQRRAGEVLARDRLLARPGADDDAAAEGRQFARHEVGEGRPGLVLLGPGAAGEGADDDAARARCRGRCAAPRPAARWACATRAGRWSPAAASVSPQQHVAEVPVDLQLVHARGRGAARAEQQAARLRRRGPARAGRRGGTPARWRRNMGSSTALSRRREAADRRPAPRA